MVEAGFFYKHLARPGVIPKQGHAEKKNDAMSYNAALDYSSRPAPFRKVSLWCSIGDSSKDIAVLEKIISHGMNVACLDLAYGTQESYIEIIQNIRGVAAASSSRFVAIALETRGPEIRTGGLDGDVDCPVMKGDTLRITTDKAFINKGNGGTVYVDCEDIIKAVQPEDRIMVGDGSIPLFVTGIHGSNIITTVEADGVLKSLRSVFVPNVKLPLPSVSEEDKETLTFGLTQDIDFILASRVRHAEDVNAIKEFLGMAGQHIQVIAKIECFEAMQNIDQIIEVADGIYINRFYIGVEVPAEKVFIAQKNIIAKCTVGGVLVIVARQFIDSMMTRNRPTSAESLDIANAVVDGADGIHISETAGGNHPVRCVAAVCAACVEAESAANQWARFRERANLMHNTDTLTTIALAAVEAAYKVDAAAIFCFAWTGSTAKAISMFKPHVPIVSIINNERLARQLGAYFGVYPCLYTNVNDDYTPEEDWAKFLELRSEYAILFGKISGFIRSGDPIIMVHGFGATATFTDVMRIVYVSDVVTPIAY